jgi:membrane protein DedA with SNARE-associated domain
LKLFFPLPVKFSELMFLSMPLSEATQSLWIYLALALAVAVEGPLVTLLAAVAAANGYLNLGWVFVAATIGNLSADTGWYGLGYLGQAGWLHRYGRWIRVSPQTVARLERDIHRNAYRLLFFAKLTLGLVIPALIATGLARVPLRRWFLQLALAEFLWTGGLVVAGYFFGAYVQNLERGVQWLAVGGGLLGFVVVSRYLIRQRARRED